MVKALRRIADALQGIYTELHAITDAVYSLQVIAELLSDNEEEG